MKKISLIGLFLTISVAIFLYFFIVKDKSIDVIQPTNSNIPIKLRNSYYYSEYHLNNKFVIYVDFSKSRNKKRLWIIDNGKVIANSYTSHGGGSHSSNYRPPNKFSNKIGSNQSSLGIYKIFSIKNMNPKKKHFCVCRDFVKTNKCSHYGKKFPLMGLEKSNYFSLVRGILIHTSSFVSEKMCTGNSDGCFVVSPEVFEIIQGKNINFLKKCYLVALK
jgi:hypothetical protein